MSYLTSSANKWSRDSYLLFIILGDWSLSLYSSLSRLSLFCVNLTAKGAKEGRHIALPSPFVKTSLFWKGRERELVFSGGHASQQTLEDQPEQAPRASRVLYRRGPRDHLLRPEGDRARELWCCLLCE